MNEKTFRVYVEETSSRVWYRDIKAPTKGEAEKQAAEILRTQDDVGEWEGWRETHGAEASVEVREELTETLEEDKA